MIKLTPPGFRVRHVVGSLAFAHNEVPVPITLRLYFPRDWTKDGTGPAPARVSESIAFEPRVTSSLRRLVLPCETGVRFGMFLADAGYGSSANVRAGFMQRGLQGKWVCG